MFKLYIMLFVHCVKYDRTFPRSHAAAAAAAAVSATWALLVIINAVCAE